MVYGHTALEPYESHRPLSSKFRNFSTFCCQLWPGSEFPTEITEIAYSAFIRNNMASPSPPLRPCFVQETHAGVYLTGRPTPRHPATPAQRVTYPITGVLTASGPATPVRPSDRYPRQTSGPVTRPETREVADLKQPLIGPFQDCVVRGRFPKGRPRAIRKSVFQAELLGHCSLVLCTIGALEKGGHIFGGHGLGKIEALDESALQRAQGFELFGCFDALGDDLEAEAP